MVDVKLGDAYELIKQVPDHSVDLVYTDIPYFFGSGSGIKTSDKLATPARLKLYQSDLTPISKGIDLSILDEFVRVCKKVHCYIWCSKLQIFPILKYFVERGCMYDILCWCKRNVTPFANNTYLPQIEYCLLVREEGTNINHCSEPNCKRKYWESGTNVADKGKYLHPTIKPLPFVEMHIKNSTEPGDFVLDPFCGSGTTLVAAKRAGRNALGFEIEEKYYKIAKDRINGWDQNGQMNLFDMEENNNER